MLDERKIRIMTLMAIYDKKYGIIDRKTDGFFRGSFIYKNNCITRVGVFFGMCILFCMYVGYHIFCTEFDFVEFDYRLAAIRWIVAAAVLLFIYSIIGTIKYGKQYDLASKRLKNYEYMVKRLNSINDNK